MNRIEINFAALDIDNLDAFHELARAWIPLGNPLLLQIASALFLERSRRAIGVAPQVRFIDVDASAEGAPYLIDAFLRICQCGLTLHRRDRVEAKRVTADLLHNLCESMAIEMDDFGEGTIH